MYQDSFCFIALQHWYHRQPLGTSSGFYEQICFRGKFISSNIFWSYITKSHHTFWKYCSKYWQECHQPNVRTTHFQVLNFVQTSAYTGIYHIVDPENLDGVPLVEDEEGHDGVTQSEAVDSTSQKSYASTPTDSMR